MNILVTSCAKSDQILRDVISQSASPFNMMDLKIFNSPARLATPPVALENFLAKLSISFGLKPHAGALGTDFFQSVTFTSSNSWLRCGFGSAITNRARQGNKASCLPVSKLTPARKSAQIISRQ
jgi:hypothetical protein